MIIVILHKTKPHGSCKHLEEIFQFHIEDVLVTNTKNERVNFMA